MKTRRLPFMPAKSLKPQQSRRNKAVTWKPSLCTLLKRSSSSQALCLCSYPDLCTQESLQIQDHFGLLLKLNNSRSISYPAPEIPARKRCFNAERGLNSGVTGLDDFDFQKLMHLQVDQSRIQGTRSREAGTKYFLDIWNTFLSPSSSTFSSIAASATFCS